MWVGHSEHSLDAKNRVFLPKRFAAGLDLTRADERPKVVLTRGFEGCLFLFSKSGYARETARVPTQAFAGPEQRLLTRLFFTQSYDVELDAQLRVLLPERLKEFAGIDREVVVLGLKDRIEIWAKDRWTAFEAAHLDDFDRLDGLVPKGGATPGPSGEGGNGGNGVEGA